MEQQSVLATGEAPLSRRALREAAERESRRPARVKRTAAAQRPATTSTHRWIPRAAVLTSLAMATIAVPLSANAGTGASSDLQAGALDAADTPTPVGPSAVSVLSASDSETVAPASLAQAVSSDERVVKAASRSEERAPLTASGCDINTLPKGSNGQLTDEGMCELWGSGNYVRSDAADALTALNEAYVAEYGVNMCISDAYRSLSAQYATKARKGGLAATAGKSEHGWGLAVDLCGETYKSSEKTQWLQTNAPLYGWDNPAWARPGGTKLEPWHWEFTEGVEAHD